MEYGFGWLSCYGINVCARTAHPKPTAARGENELACEIDSPSPDHSSDQMNAGPPRGAYLGVEGVGSGVEGECDVWVGVSAGVVLMFSAGK